MDQDKAESLGLLLIVAVIGTCIGIYYVAFQSKGSDAGAYAMFGFGVAGCAIVAAALKCVTKPYQPAPKSSAEPQDSEVAR